MEPFKTKDLKQPNTIHRLLKRKPIENAFIEFNNYLAEKTLDEIDKNKISNLSKIYALDFHKKFDKELLDIYEQYVNFCLTKISDKSTIQLINKFREILGIDKEKADEIFKSIALEFFQSEYEKIIEDSIVDLAEKKRLDNLESLLGLPQAQYSEVYDDCRRRFIKEYFNKIISDGRVTPEEEKELEKISKNLDIQVSFEGQAEEIYNKCKLLWKIENDTIPETEVDIQLQRNEKCYFTTFIDWYEYRKRTKRIGYGGPSFRIKIAKGFYYRIGNYAIQRTSEDVLIIIDSGDLFLSNKRLIFIGDKKSTNIRLNRIMNYELYKNGVQIIKDAGRNPFLGFEKNVEIFGAILARAISEY